MNMIRPATRSDIARINTIADAVHPNLCERPEVFERLLGLFPTGVWAVDHAGAVVGYAVAHPWLLGTVPVLDTPLRALPPDTDVLHIHDVGIVPEYRGFGLSGRVIRECVRVAHMTGLARLSLVAVHDTAGLWHSHGFACAECRTTSLLSYGPGAKYMTRGVPV